MSAPDPRWIPVFAAFDTLRKQYEAMNYYANEEVCWQVANDMLLRRLELGQLPARASLVSLDYDEAFASGMPELSEPDAEGTIRVPPKFWRYFAKSKAIDRESDWFAGDFSFLLSGVPYRGFVPGCQGHVIGLEIDSNFLPMTKYPDESPVPSSGGRTGGRSPANWWPDFAEELAVYIHENGLPQGEGHDGQSAVIDAVFSRMVEKGKPEPGRGTVQPVVNAVLRRIRSAGN